MKAIERGQRVKPTATRVGNLRGNQMTRRAPEPGTLGGHHPSDQELVESYQQQTREHRSLQRKADHAQAALKTAQKIFKELFADPEFVSLLRIEGKGTAPRYLVNGATDVEMVR
jgi:ParB family chromosome partitioning protein